MNELIHELRQQTSGEILYYVEVSSNARDAEHHLADIANAYAVVSEPEAHCGLIVYAHYHGKWEANAGSTRWLIKDLLARLAEHKREPRLPPDAIQRLRDAGLSAWDDVKDVEAFLKEIRG